MDSSIIIRAPLHVQVGERLRELIDQGVLAPGMRLNEAELCSQLGVSRTPLREAMRALASEGLLELQPNRGAIVSIVTVEDLTEILPIMSVLEGLAGRLACQCMVEDKILEVREIHDTMIGHYRRKELTEYFQTNRLIHELITEGSGNQSLMESINSLSAKVRRARFTTQMTDDSWARAVSEHEEMIDALENRDGIRLEQVIIRHVEAKGATILGAINVESQVHS